MSNMSGTKNCWVITEGIAGTENQCIGVAERLGVAFEVKRIILRQPWKSLSPYLGSEQSWSFSPALTAPWPDIVLAAGRKAIAAARYIKRQSPDTYIAFIQDPRIPAPEFDLIAAPAHDKAFGDTVMQTIASPNRITQDKLDEAVKAFPHLQSTKQPRTAVMIGGKSKAYDITPDMMRRICKMLKAKGNGLMITASRRTGAENLKILQDEMADYEDAYIWDGTGENPYFAFLAWADTILVTADSASMLSEACSTGKPVYIVPLKGHHPRIAALHQNLIDHGAAKLFSGKTESWTYEPLNDAQSVADRILNDLKDREKSS
jgi:mitochondrial fission protein ELM1